VGKATYAPPRVEELEKALSKISVADKVVQGLGPENESYFNRESVMGRQIAFHERLPSDMQRAAPETYRSIRAEGVATVRQWVLEQFPVNARGTQEFAHLHQSACQADFILAKAATEEHLNLLFNTEDQLEIIFRDIGALCMKSGLEIDPVLVTCALCAHLE